MGWESARYKQIQTADAAPRCLKFPWVSRLSTCYSQTIRQMARCPFRARAAVMASAVTPTSRQDLHITRDVAKYQGSVSFHVAEPSGLFLVPVRTVDVALDGYTLVGLSDHISAYICKRPNDRGCQSNGADSQTPRREITGICTTIERIRPRLSRAVGTPGGIEGGKGGVHNRPIVENKGKTPVQNVTISRSTCINDTSHNQSGRERNVPRPT